jgi:hypothetical protein
MALTDTEVEVLPKGGVLATLGPAKRAYRASFRSGVETAPRKPRTNSLNVEVDDHGVRSRDRLTGQD